MKDENQASTSYTDGPLQRNIHDLLNRIKEISSRYSEDTSVEAENARKAALVLQKILRYVDAKLLPRFSDQSTTGVMDMPTILNDLRKRRNEIEASPLRLYYSEPPVSSDEVPLVHAMTLDLLNEFLIHHDDITINLGDMIAFIDPESLFDPLLKTVIQKILDMFDSGIKLPSLNSNNPDSPSVSFQVSREKGLQTIDLATAWKLQPTKMLPKVVESFKNWPNTEHAEHERHTTETLGHLVAQESRQLQRLHEEYKEQASQPGGLNTEASQQDLTRIEAELQRLRGLQQTATDTLERLQTCQERYKQQSVNQLLEQHGLPALPAYAHRPLPLRLYGYEPTSQRFAIMTFRADLDSTIETIRQQIQEKNQSITLKIEATNILWQEQQQVVIQAERTEYEQYERELEHVLRKIQAQTSVALDPQALKRIQGQLRAMQTRLLAHRETINNLEQQYEAHNFGNCLSHIMEHGVLPLQRRSALAMESLTNAQNTLKYRIEITEKHLQKSALEAGFPATPDAHSLSTWLQKQNEQHERFRLQQQKRREDQSQLQQQVTRYTDELQHARTEHERLGQLITNDEHLLHKIPSQMVQLADDASSLVQLPFQSTGLSAQEHALQNWLKNTPPHPEKLVQLLQDVRALLPDASQRHIPFKEIDSLLKTTHKDCGYSDFGELMASLKPSSPAQASSSSSTEADTTNWTEFRDKQDSLFSFKPAEEAYKTAIRSLSDAIDNRIHVLKDAIAVQKALQGITTWRTMEHETRHNFAQHQTAQQNHHTMGEALDNSIKTRKQELTNISDELSGMDKELAEQARAIALMTKTLALMDKIADESATSDTELTNHATRQERWCDLNRQYEALATKAAATLKSDANQDKCLASLKASLGQLQQKEDEIIARHTQDLSEALAALKAEQARIQTEMGNTDNPESAVLDDWSMRSRSFAQRLQTIDANLEHLKKSATPQEVERLQSIRTTFDDDSKIMGNTLSLMRQIREQRRRIQSFATTKTLWFHDKTASTDHANFHIEQRSVDRHFSELQTSTSKHYNDSWNTCLTKIEQDLARLKQEQDQALEQRVQASVTHLSAELETLDREHNLIQEAINTANAPDHATITDWHTRNELLPQRLQIINGKIAGLTGFDTLQTNQMVSDLQATRARVQSNMDQLNTNIRNAANTLLSNIRQTGERQHTALQQQNLVPQENAVVTQQLNEIAAQLAPLPSDETLADWHGTLFDTTNTRATLQTTRQALEQRQRIDTAIETRRDARIEVVTEAIRQLDAYRSRDWVNKHLRSNFIAQVKNELLDWRDQTQPETYDTLMTTLDNGINQFQGLNIRALCSHIACAVRDEQRRIPTDYLAEQREMNQEELLAEYNRVMYNGNALSYSPQHLRDITAINGGLAGLQVYHNELEDNDPGKETLQRLIHKLQSDFYRFVIKHSQQRPTPEELKQFQHEFKQRVHSEDRILSQHNNRALVILANVLLGVLSLGVALLGKSIYSKVQYGYSSLFFERTENLDKLDELDQSLEALFSARPS